MHHPGGPGNWSTLDLKRYLARDVDRDGGFVPHPFNELALYVEELRVRFSHRTSGMPGMLGAVQGLLALPDVSAAEAHKFLSEATRKPAGIFPVLASGHLASRKLARGLTALRTPDAITGPVGSGKSIIVAASGPRACVRATWTTVSVGGSANTAVRSR